MKSPWPKTWPAGVGLGDGVSVGAGVGLGEGVAVGVGEPVGGDDGAGGDAQAAAASRIGTSSSPRIAMAAKTRSQALRLHGHAHRLGSVSNERPGLDYGLIGALADIGFATVLGLLLAFAIDSRGDALPRPLVIGALYATPGLIGLIGVLMERPWLLIAAALPLFPAAGLSMSGATLPFLAPALLMIVGATRMVGRPEGPRITVASAIAGGIICALILVAGWAVLIGMTTPACYPVSGGQACGSGFISTNGVLVAGICLVMALAIAVVGARSPRLSAHQD